MGGNEVEFVNSVETLTAFLLDRVHLLEHRAIPRVNRFENTESACLAEEQSVPFCCGHLEDVRHGCEPLPGIT